MALFKTYLSLKVGECRRLANQIASAAKAMGLAADVDKSRVSASTYVTVSDDTKEAGMLQMVKIRCSDHDDHHGGSDWYAWAGDCPSKTIARVAAVFGRAVPEGYREEDYKKRSAVAIAAATARRLANVANEATMVQAAARDVPLTSNLSLVAAGRIVDKRFPALPRAQRQRLAAKLSGLITKKFKLAQAAGNEAALAELGKNYHEAREALFDLVGPDRFVSLRPSGFPRSHWVVKGKDAA